MDHRHFLPRLETNAKSWTKPVFVILGRGTIHGSATDSAGRYVAGPKPAPALCKRGAIGLGIVAGTD